MIAGDQYVADVLPARMFASEFERRGLAPQVLSRAVEDSGTVTSVLVPWNTCGAYISGVLGVSTASYFPYCFFNLLSPILDVVYGFVGFKAAPSASEAVNTAPPARRPGDGPGGLSVRLLVDDAGATSDLECPPIARTPVSGPV